jgi:hypothetical protein
MLEVYVKDKPLKLLQKCRILTPEKKKEKVSFFPMPNSGHSSALVVRTQDARDSNTELFSVTKTGIGKAMSV